MARKQDTDEDLTRLVDVHVQRVAWSPGVEFLLTAGPLYPNGPRYAATGITFEKMETDTYEIKHPTFSLRHEKPQQLMDALWSLGIRPSEGDGSTGQLGATERHLKDMRAIVADKLKVPLE